MNLPERPRVLDIGCGIDGRSFSDHVPETWSIVGIDLHADREVKHRHPGFSYVQGSATDLSCFQDKQFDLAVSIGMLEHLLGDDYLQAAREIQRVAASYVVVVPWRWAIIEPHFAFPLFGVLPQRAKEFIVASVLHRDNPSEHVKYLRQNFEWRRSSQYRRDFPGSITVLSATFDTLGIVGGRLKAT